MNQMKVMCVKCKLNTNFTVYLTHCGHAYHLACIENLQERGAKRVCIICDKIILITKLRKLDVTVDMQPQNRHLLNISKSLEADKATIQSLQTSNAQSEEVIKTLKNNMREHIDTELINKHVECKETARMLPYQLELLMESGTHHDKWNTHNNIKSDFLKKAGARFYGENGTETNAVALQL